MRRAGPPAPYICFVPPVLDRADDLTPQWLSAALGRDVVAVATEPIGAGQMGSSWRLTLTYRGEPGPSSLVAKLAGGSDAARAQMAFGYRKEIGFYLQLASTLKARVPQCWYGAISEDGANFTLLLEDLTPSVPGVQAQSCSVAQASGAVRNLAALHASRWNDPTLRDADFLAPIDGGMAELFAAALIDATEAFVARYEDDLGDDDAETLRAAAQAMAPWLLERHEPFAIVHGDYRLDNLMFAPHDGEVAALDWQSVSAGPPGRDLAYFIGTAFDAADRRRHEEGLVAGYHEGLLAHGVAGYPFDRCVEDYRAGHLQGPLITVLGAIHATAGRSDNGDRMFIAMATRTCAAIRDLRSLELVGTR